MYFDFFRQQAVPDFAMRNERQVFQESLDRLAFTGTCGFCTAWKKDQDDSGIHARIGMTVGLL